MILIVNIFFFFQAEDGIRDRNVTEFRRVLFRSILTLAINRAFQRICCKKRISDIFLSTTAKIISVKKNILHTVAIALPRISKTRSEERRVGKESKTRRETERAKREKERKKRKKN